MDSQATSDIQRKMTALAEAYPGLAGMSEDEMNGALSDCAFEARKSGILSMIYAGCIVAGVISFAACAYYSKTSNAMALLLALGPYVALFFWARRIWFRQLRCELNRCFGHPPSNQKTVTEDRATSADET